MKRNPATSAGTLPDGWRLLRTEEVGDVRLGRQRSPKNRSALFPTAYIRAANITERGLDLSNVLQMDFKPEERDRYRLQPGDLVLAEASGSASQVGKPAVWNNELPLCCFQNTVVRLRPRAADSRYLLWLFRHFYRNGVFARVAGGVGINHLRAAKFSQLMLPIAPKGEQRRIVAEIDKQVTRLEAGVAALRRVHSKLKRYRAAVLKAASEGRLVPTEAELARKEGRSYETGEQLLTRILTERRRKWTGRGKYREPASADDTELPPLPNGWVWASLDQISWASSYGTSAKCAYEAAGPPVLRIPNIAGGRVDLNDLKFASVNEKIAAGDELACGDLLIIRTNGSKSLIGRSAVVRENPERPTTYASYLIRFRLAEQPSLFGWVSAVWDAGFLRGWIERRAATSAGQHNVSMSVLSTLPFPVPPIAEQERMVAEVERRLSVIDALEGVVAANLQRAARLRQSILDRAFTGRLVSNDGASHQAADDGIKVGQL